LDEIQISYQRINALMITYLDDAVGEFEDTGSNKKQPSHFAQLKSDTFDFRVGQGTKSVRKERGQKLEATSGEHTAVAGVSVVAALDSRVGYELEGWLPSAKLFAHVVDSVRAKLEGDERIVRTRGLDGSVEIGESVETVVVRGGGTNDGTPTWSEKEAAKQEVELHDGCGYGRDLSRCADFMGRFA